MAMLQVRKADALSKSDFHRQLRVWLLTNEHRVGPEGEFGAAGWIFVRDGAAFFKLNSDTKRPAVEAYLATVDLHGDTLDWHVVENSKGNWTAVAYGPEKLRMKSFYLYTTGTDSRETGAIQAE